MIAPHIATLAIRGRSDEEVERDARALGVALNAEELLRIAERLGRDPTIVEVHAFDAQWSEHCSYKSSRAFLARLPTEGPDVVLGPGEDAGILRLGEWEGERYGIVVAHESHNHPSQVVPFEGAATGIGGIVRDVLCMGARVIAVADPLRLGPLDEPHCRYVAQGVVDGIAAYGNAIGVPNIAGDVFFHEGFRDNCLVNVVALGLLKERDVIHSRAPAGADGWDIVLVGKATDRSGFGGASFSSLVLDEDDAEANKGAVQVPDPFLKNVLMRATYRAFDVIAERRLAVGFKDLGAGGIVGCTAELSGSGGFGATIDLERCPTSQPNLPPAVIAVGETQERVAWVVPPEFTPRLLSIYNDEYGLPEIAEGACAAVIGRVHERRDYVLRWYGDEVMRVPIDFLCGGLRYERPYERPSPFSTDPVRWRDSLESSSDGKPPRMLLNLADPFFSSGSLGASLAALLTKVLEHRDVCSRKTIYERYDSVVRGTTSIPAGLADAGLIVPISGARLGVALGVGGNPRYGAIDPHRSGELAVCEAVRNVVAVGARPLGLTDCLNFGNPEVPRQFGEFVAAVDGLSLAARALNLAFVSGNVSLYNESAGGSAVPASAVVACVGAVDDVSKTATLGFKRAGSPLYRLGAPTFCFGGSVYAAVAEITDSQPLPLVDYGAMAKELAALLTAYRRGLVLAAHDVSDGGLLVTLAEMGFRTLGAEPIGVLLDENPFLDAFDETGAFIVEVTDAGAFEAVCAEHGVEVWRHDQAAGKGAQRLAIRTSLVTRNGGGYAERIGWTTREAVLAAPSFAIELQRLHEAWSAPLRDFYGDAA